MTRAEEDALQQHEEHEDLDRLDSFVDGMAGKRLTYKDLIQ